MVEVFKTNVKTQEQADMLLDYIHNIFADYRSNFDLWDSDSILRVKSTTGTVEVSLIIDLLKNYGFSAEVLPDEVPAYPANTSCLVCRV